MRHYLINDASPSFIFSNITLVKIVLNFLFHLFYQVVNRYICSVLLH